MTRPIGPQMLSVCEMIEAKGPLNTRDLKASIPCASNQLIRQTCIRALEKGFLTSDGESPPLYSVAPGWRAMVNGYGISEKKPAVWKIPAAKDVKRLTPTAIVRSMPSPGARNSIFDMTGGWHLKT